MLQDTPDEMFKYMIQCITDSVNSKYNDVNTATVCQVCLFVCLSVCSCMSDVRLFVFSIEASIAIRYTTSNTEKLQL